MISAKTTLITTTKTSSPNESSPFTTGSVCLDIQAQPQSDDHNVIWAEDFFFKPNSVPTSEFVDADVLADELNDGPEWQEAIARASADLAKSEIGRARLAPIAQLRLALGLSQAQLARLTATSQSHIARIELNTCDPQLSTMKRLAQALNVSVGRLAALLAGEAV